MSWIRRETEKETVQYICPHCHDYHEFRVDFGERTFSENYIFCRRCGERNGTGNAPTLTPPNEPLTLEQLREMDGEPVWVQTPGIPQYGRWVIVAGIDTNDGQKTLYCQGDYTCRNYGQDWLAYRRPPEGEEDT